MEESDVNLIRDAASALSAQNLDLAHGLMDLAHRTCPESAGIGKQLQAYRDRMASRDEESFGRLHALLASGELAIIPVGFRCFTATSLKEKLGIKQATLPFDVGFFPPPSVARLLETRRVAMKYPDPNRETHTVCRKREFVQRGDKLGVTFERSSYEEINRMAKTPDQPNINSLFDNTFGYYTLDEHNGFILAHYNWHSFASPEKSKGIHDPEKNIPNINRMMNARIERMLDMCNLAQKILFIFDETQNYDFMSIDDKEYDLSDLSMIHDVVARRFGGRALVISLKEIDTPTKLLAQFDAI